MENDVDVVVVGAGPVGLLAAIELTLGGVRVRVLERLAEPSQVGKALGIGALGSEALQRRGMAAAMADAEARSFAARAQASGRGGTRLRDMSSKYAGHFGGLLIRKDALNEPDRRARFVDQQAVEAMLADRANALGIEIRRAHEVIGIVQQTDGIDVAWVSPSGRGGTRCSYLVGCDGGRSRIRKLAGFAFPGTDPTMTMYQAVCAIDHPERFASSGWQRTSGGVFAWGLFPGRLFMLDFSGPPEDRQAPVTREEIEDALRRISCADVRVMSLENGSRWTDNTRLVDTYRLGRVLLAGDAAHIHSPFGGQGLSLGLVDAANLGWKLAAIIRGEMPDSLLDSYTAAVAETVLANTLAQAAIMRPDPQSGAMRDIVAKLMQLDDVNRAIGEMMSGLSVRYELGSARDEVGRLIGDISMRPSDADGPTDRTSLYDLMRDGRGVFIDASREGIGSKLAATTQRIVCIAADRTFHVDPPRWLHCMGRRSRQHRRIGGSAPSLVRPNVVSSGRHPKARHRKARHPGLRGRPATCDADDVAPSLDVAPSFAQAV